LLQRAIVERLTFAFETTLVGESITMLLDADLHVSASAAGLP
jgi:hypothetical protein